MISEYPEGHYYQSSTKRKFIDGKNNVVELHSNIHTYIHILYAKTLHDTEGIFEQKREHREP